MTPRASRPAAPAAALRVAAVLAATCALSAVTLAEGPATCPAIDPPAAVMPAVRAFVDPATGAVRPPTPEERAALAARKSAERAAALRNVKIVTHANGMKTAELGDAFLFDVVVEKRPDGTLGYRCVPRSSTATLPKETK